MEREGKGSEGVAGGVEDAGGLRNRCHFGDWYVRRRSGTCGMAARFLARTVSISPGRHGGSSTIFSSRYLLTKRYAVSHILSCTLVTIVIQLNNEMRASTTHG